MSRVKTMLILSFIKLSVSDYRVENTGNLAEITPDNKCKQVLGCFCWNTMFPDNFAVCVKGEYCEKLDERIVGCKKRGILKKFSKGLTSMIPFRKLAGSKLESKVGRLANELEEGVSSSPTKI